MFDKDEIDLSELIRLEEDCSPATGVHCGTSCQSGQSDKKQLNDIWQVCCWGINLQVASAMACLPAIFEKIQSIKEVFCAN